MRRTHTGRFAARPRPGWLAVAVLALSVLADPPAQAALAKAQLDTVVATPSADATVPSDLRLTDPQGRPIRFGQLLAGRPSLLILADYRCTQLCGSILGIAARALQASGLRPNQDFSLLIVGFNPDASAGDGDAMRDEQMGAYPELRSAARVLTGSPAAVDRLEHVLGFTAIRDVAAGRFAHPADVFVLTADGHVARILNALSLDPDAVRLALVEAGQGRIGSLIDRLHVLCYGLDPLSGASTGLAQTMLRTGGGLTLGAAGLLVALSVRRRRAVMKRVKDS